MSEQLTSQSRSSSGISRRTALRGAAWSVPAVTVVVAAPAHATASGALTYTGALTKSPKHLNPEKYNDSVDKNIKHVKWQDLNLTNTGTGPLDDLHIKITFNQNAPTGVLFTVSSSTGTWTTSGSGTIFEASYAGSQEPLAPRQMLTFTPNFKGDNNASGSMKVEFYSKAVLLGSVQGGW